MDSRHIRTTPITAELYLWNQLSKSTVDTVDDILKHFETKHNKI